MDYLLIEQFDRFACIGSACPISCCVGWNVWVDEQSEAYYRTVGGSFGKYLNDNLLKTDSGRTRMRLIDGRCAFLDERNLCRIYTELGKDRLCNTCAQFPRGLSRAGNLSLISLHLTCPEAVRMILASPNPIEIFSAEDEEEPSEKPDFDWNYFALLSKTLLAGIGILQNRSLTIAHRQRLFLLMCKAVDDTLDAGDWKQANEYLNLFSESEAYRSLHAEEAPMNLTAKIRVLADTSLLFGLYELEHKGSKASRLFADSVSWLRGSDEHLAAACKRLELLNQEPYAAEQEHFMVCLMFRHFLKTMEHRSLLRAGAFITLFNQFQRLFTACCPETEAGESLPPLDRRVATICHLSRMLAHNDYFPAVFHELLYMQNYYDLETLYQIVS